MSSPATSPAHATAIRSALAEFVRWWRTGGWYLVVAIGFAS